MDPKNMEREGAKIVTLPYNQVVKVGEGWVDLEPMLLTIARLPNE